MLAGVATPGEPRLTGGMGCRRGLSTDLPPSPVGHVTSHGIGGASWDGRARPERPGTAGLSLGCEGHEGIPQGFGLLGHRCDLAFTVLRFIRVEALLDIRAPMLQQAKTRRASLCAVAVMAFGVPRRLCIRRRRPQALLRVVQSPGGEARATVTRCAPRAPATGLAPEIWCCGHSPSQLQKCLTSANGACPCRSR